MISERKQFRVFLERRPVVQEALYKWYAIVCPSGDAFHVGLLKVWFPLYVALVGVFYRRSGKGCRFNGSRLSNTE